MLNKNSDICKELLAIGGATQSEKQTVIDKHVESTFIEMKPKRCTHEFSTPRIASEALALMKKDIVNFSTLIMMKKRNKLSPELKRVVSRATGKPLMEWVAMNTQEQEVAA